MAEPHECVSLVRPGNFSIFPWETMKASDMSSERSHASKRRYPKNTEHVSSCACKYFPGAHLYVCSLSEVKFSHWRGCVEERADVMQITLELMLLWKPIKYHASLGNCISPPGTQVTLNAWKKLLFRQTFTDLNWTSKPLLYSPSGLTTRKDTGSSEFHTSSEKMQYVLFKHQRDSLFWR